MIQTLDLFALEAQLEPPFPVPVRPIIKIPQKTKAAIYTRVSTDDQNTDLQRSELLAQANYRDWEPLIYEDQGISGANFDRPALNRLLADADAGRIKVIMAWKLDRIGRSTQHLAGIINRLLKADVGLVVPSQGIDTSAGSMNPASKLQLNVLAAVAEFERDLIRERTKAGLKAARERGVRLGRETVVTTDQRTRGLKILEESPSITVTRFARELGLSLGTGSRLRTLLSNKG